MATEAQIAANRRNAQKSTGPRTPEGKARSSRNALRHGLASISPHSFLTVEDKSAFERMLHGYILTYEPNHADEVDLVTDAVFCKWRQQRLWSTEAQLVEMTIAEQQHDLQRKLPKANAAAHVANATRHCSEENRLNRRYEAQLHRQYGNNLKLLGELQAKRIDREPTLDQLYPDEAQPSLATHATPAPAASSPGRETAVTPPAADTQPGGPAARPPKAA
jgi:hypothetical protein